MKFLRTTIFLAAVSAVVSVNTGCAAIASGATNAGVDQAAAIDMTAKHFSVDKKAVTMVSFDKGLLGTNYQVRVDGKLYNCIVQYGALSGCKQPGT